MTIAWIREPVVARVVLILFFCVASCVAAAGGGEASEPPRAAPVGRLEIVYSADGSVFPPDVTFGPLSRVAPDGPYAVEIREESVDPDSFLRAGTASQRTGDHAAAESSFRRGLALAPDHPGLRAALGWTLFQTGRPAEAVTEYRRALAVSPDDARTHHNLALALRATGDLSGAGKHFTRSLAIEPRCEVYADFGLLQDLFGREDLARESYEKGIALDAICAAARMNLASMLLEDGKYEEAAVQYRKVVEAKPTAAAHSGLGFALNQLGRLDEAAAQHDAAVALDASLAEVHRNRALTQARLKKYDEAILSYRRAVAIEPRVSTYYSLAGVLRAAGRGEEAEAEYRRGQELSRRQQDRSSSAAAPSPSPQARRAPEPIPTGGRAGMPN